MGKRSKTPVTVESMMNWLDLAYSQSKALGYCTPSSYQLPGRSNVSVAAHKAGIIRKRDEEDKFKGSKWVDMRAKPSRAMAEKLLAAYTEYRLSSQKKSAAKKNGSVPPDAGQQPEAMDTDAINATLTNICKTLDQIEGHTKQLVKIWKKSDSNPRRTRSRATATD
jgi:hypothetical protein